MAPAKRKGAASSARAAKAAKMADTEENAEPNTGLTPIERDVNMLVEYLESAEKNGYTVMGPNSNVQMLKEVGVSALLEAAEDRHAWQKVMVSCLSDAVHNLEQRIAGDLCSWEQRLGKADEIENELVTKKAALEKEFEEKSKTLDALRTLLNEKKVKAAGSLERKEEKEEELDAAKERCAALESEKNEIELNLNVHVERLWTPVEDDDVPTAERAAAVLNMMEARGQETIAKSAAAAFNTLSTDRGDFDGMVFGAVKKFLSSELVACNGKILEEDVKRQTIELAFNALDKEADEDHTSRVHATEDVDVAAKAKTETNKEIKATQKELTAHKHEMQTADKTILKLKGYLDSVRIGVRLFSLLESRTKVVKKAEEPEVAEPERLPFVEVPEQQEVLV